MEEKNINHSLEWTRWNFRDELIQFLLILQKKQSSFREVLQIPQGHEVTGGITGPRTKLRTTR